MTAAVIRAVSVWGAMAWAKAEGRKWPRGASWSNGYSSAKDLLSSHLRALAAERRAFDFEREAMRAEVAAIRAANRKRQARLRWRRQHAEQESQPSDRLAWRAWASTRTGRLWMSPLVKLAAWKVSWMNERRPVHGPKGVLP